MNNTLCKNGIKHEYYLMFALLGVLLSLFVLITTIYLSENVIRGIYNEEIQYVKTNKLRYDWNWLNNYKYNG